MDYRLKKDQSVSGWMEDAREATYAILWSLCVMHIQTEVLAKMVVEVEMCKWRMMKIMNSESVLYIHGTQLEWQWSNLQLWPSQTAAPQVNLPIERPFDGVAPVFSTK